MVVYFADPSVGEGSRSTGQFTFWGLVYLIVQCVLSLLRPAGAPTVAAFVKDYAQLTITERLLLRLKDHEDCESSRHLIALVTRSLRTVRGAVPEQLKAWCPEAVKLDEVGVAAVRTVLSLCNKSFGTIASEGVLTEALLGPLHAIRVPAVPLLRFGFVFNVSQSLSIPLPSYCAVCSALQGEYYSQVSGKSPFCRPIQP